MYLEDKIDVVCDILKDKKVAVGFSGGADSTLIAYLSSKVAKDTLAITIDNHLLPTEFVENAKKITESFAIRHEIVDIDFYEDEDFLKNDSGRCFNCRRLMYSRIEQTARENGFDFICDGNNISDLVIDRPGILVTYAKNFKTPFIEAKLTSKEIHKYLNDNDIPYFRSTTCLATRLKTDVQITPERIRRIRNCEDYISQNTNCEIVKVRDFGELGIIEVDNIDEIFYEDAYIHIDANLKCQGFEKLALNLTEIDDNEYIEMTPDGNSFSYQLPYTINLEDTKKQLENIIFEDAEKIRLENMEIFENGFVRCHDLETYEIALDEFMEILPKLRRNI